MNLCTEESSIFLLLRIKKEFYFIIGFFITLFIAVESYYFGHQYFKASLVFII
jgi:hypothetical protein